MSDVGGWAQTWELCERNLAEHGVPAAAVLVREADGEILGRGRNLRYQEGDLTAHAHVEALRDAGLLTPEEIAGTYFVSTAVPCMMCAGMMVHYRFPRNYSGLPHFEGFGSPSEQFLAENGVEVVDLERHEVLDAWISYIREHPQDWWHDIGMSAEDLDFDSLYAMLGIDRTDG